MLPAIDRSGKVGVGAFSIQVLVTFRALRGSGDNPLVGVVDDDAALCSSLADLMRSSGYCAAAFTSAEALLTFGNLARVDCIIADVYMSGMGGIDLIRELHEQGVMTPVILVTALPHRQLDEEASSAGALCLLRKPFETRSLFDWVERSLPK